jgi:Icc-related predicted phosphoesterase/uncharacterized protein YprB with RNaseH-like and TPR domain
LNLVLLDYLQDYLLSNLKATDIARICKQAGLPARGSKKAMLQQARNNLPSHRINELIRSKDIIRWEDQLLFACILDSERTRKEILDTDLAKAIFSAISADEHLPRHYSANLQDYLRRKRVSALIKQGLLIKSRRGRLIFYSIEPCLRPVLNDVLVNLSAEELIGRFKASDEYSILVKYQQELQNRIARRKQLEIETYALFESVGVKEIRCVATEHSGPLRIVAFSDYRVQNIGLLLDFIQNIKPMPDMILYAGDNVLRFNNIPIDRLKEYWLLMNEHSKPIYLLKAAVHKKNAYISTTISKAIGFNIPKPEPTINESTMREYVSEVLRKKLEQDIGETVNPIERLTERIALRQLNHPCQDWILHYEIQGDSIRGFVYVPEQRDNFFEALANLSKYGLCAVCGNDDSPVVREVIQGSRVYDVHSTQVAIGPYVILGLEGAPIRLEEISLGIVLYHEGSIAKHLDEHYRRAMGKRLIIVSHTPPRDILDHALRYGERNIGSIELKRFVESHPDTVLVVSGHVHHCGGNSMNLGKATVLNAASHDNFGEPGRVALITIDEDVVHIKWHLLHEVSEICGIGPKTAQKLGEAGIRRIEDFLEIPFDQLCERTGFGMKRLEKFVVRAQAIKDGRPYVLEPPGITDTKGMYVDIETDLSGSLVWLIGLYNSATGEFRNLFAETGKEEQQILKEFVRITKGDKSPIYFYAGMGYDQRVLKNRLTHYGLCDDCTSRMVDLLPVIRRSVALPLKTYALKAVSRYFGYEYRHPTMDGFEVATRYLTEYLTAPSDGLKKLFQEYNEDDTRSPAHILERMIGICNEQPVRDVCPQLSRQVPEDVQEYDDILDDFVNGGLRSVRVEYPEKSPSALVSGLESRISGRKADIRLVVRRGQIYLTKV